jgi:hypothetical protein
MPNRHPFAKVMFAFSAICLVLAMFIALMLAVDSGQLPASLHKQYVPAACVLLGGLGFSGIILGLGCLLERQPGMPPRLQTQLQAIQDTLEAVGRTMSETPAPVAATSIPTATVVAAPPVRAIDATSLDRLAGLLEEIRDTSLMNDSQRQERLKQLLAAWRGVQIARADEMAAVGRWREGDAVLTAARGRLGPEDSVLQQAQNRYHEARVAAENLAFDRVRQTTMDHLALSAWDRAIETVRTFTLQYPDSVKGKEFAERLVQQRQEYMDRTAGELFDDVRSNTEQRSWRRAYDAAKRLLEKCPDHPRANTVKGQLDILKENAETEQRNAMESRIKEMIRAKRYPEALELAGELKSIYPDSAQAQIAQQLIEKLQYHLQNQVPAA